MPKLDKKTKDIRATPEAQTDPLRNPNGIFSGMAKRVAIEDGKFAEIQNMPGDTRNKGTVDHSYRSRTDLSRGKWS